MMVLRRLLVFTFLTILTIPSAALAETIDEMTQCLEKAESFQTGATFVIDMAAPYLPDFMAHQLGDSVDEAFGEKLNACDEASSVGINPPTKFCCTCQVYQSSCNRSRRCQWIVKIGHGPDNGYCIDR